MTKFSMATVPILMTVLGACGTPDEASPQQAGLSGPSPHELKNIKISQEEFVQARKARGTTSQPQQLAPAGAVEDGIPFGAGVAHWQFSNPAGYGYSVKDEYTNQLFWASPPSQDVDGIYRRAWGCVAIKVPDDCDYYNNGYSHSCSCWISTCTVIDPSSVGWPACPL